MVWLMRSGPHRGAIHKGTEDVTDGGCKRADILNIKILVGFLSTEMCAACGQTFQHKRYW